MCCDALIFFSVETRRAAIRALSKMVDYQIVVFDATVSDYWSECSGLFEVLATVLVSERLPQLLHVEVVRLIGREFAHVGEMISKTWTLHEKHSTYVYVLKITDSLCSSCCLEVSWSKMVCVGFIDDRAKLHFF